MTDRTQTTAVWSALVAAAKACEPNLDQWEKFKFKTEHGWVYVTISREDLHSDLFEDVSDAW